MLIFKLFNLLNTTFLHNKLVKIQPIISDDKQFVKKNTILKLIRNLLDNVEYSDKKNNNKDLHLLYKSLLYEVSQDKHTTMKHEIIMQKINIPYDKIKNKIIHLIDIYYF
jgi:hypothetical protein